MIERNTCLLRLYIARLIYHACFRPSARLRLHRSPDLRFPDPERGRPSAPRRVRRAGGFRWTPWRCSITGRSRLTPPRWPLQAARRSSSLRAVVSRRHEQHPAGPRRSPCSNSESCDQIRLLYPADAHRGLEGGRRRECPSRRHRAGQDDSPRNRRLDRLHRRDPDPSPCRASRGRIRRRQGVCSRVDRPRQASRLHRRYDPLPARQPGVADALPPGMPRPESES